MLRIAINEAVSKDDARPRLRAVAEMLVKKGMEGDIAAIKEIADRLDGKVPQAIVGSDDDPPISVQKIERVIVDSSSDKNS